MEKVTGLYSNMLGQLDGAVQARVGQRLTSMVAQVGVRGGEAKDGARQL